MQQEEADPPLGEKLELWKNTSHAAGKLSELLLLVGDLEQARHYADDAVVVADRSTNAGQRLGSRCRRAAVAHMLRDRDYAGQLFQQAIDIQREIEPLRDVLYSDIGFLYRRFRYEDIPRHEYAVFLREAQSALDIDDKHKPPNRWLVAIGLGYLSNACAHAGQAEFMTESITHAKRAFEDAYRTLLRSGSVIFFPEYYVSFARFNQHMGHAGEAIECADEALKYASDYRMPLYEADAQLLMAECYLAIGDLDQACECFGKAEQIINRCGYGRRYETIRELRPRIPRQKECI
jgi:tetratricopeptide (TPR) repeat protein